MGLVNLKGKGRASHSASLLFAQTCENNNLADIVLVDIVIASRSCS